MGDRHVRLPPDGQHRAVGDGIFALCADWPAQYTLGAFEHYRRAIAQPFLLNAWTKVRPVVQHRGARHRSRARDTRQPGRTALAVLTPILTESMSIPRWN